jgi:hypothetical protein
MKVLLGPDDLLDILCQHFDSEFTRETVRIPDELEIVINDVPVPASERRTGTTPTRTVPPPRSTPAALRTADPDNPPITDPTETDLEKYAARGDPDASLDAPTPGADGFVGESVAGSPRAILEQSRELEARLERERGPKQRKGGTAKPPTSFNEELA